MSQRTLSANSKHIRGILLTLEISRNVNKFGHVLFSNLTCFIWNPKPSWQSPNTVGLYISLTLIIWLIWTQPQNNETHSRNCKTFRMRLLGLAVTHQSQSMKLLYVGTG